MSLVPNRPRRPKIGPNILFERHVCRDITCALHDHSKGCHVWIGRKRDGYGEFRLYIGYKRFRRIPSHVYAYYLANKSYPINYGCHACNNKLCVLINSQHVYDGTSKDNRRDLTKRLHPTWFNI